ncbi:DUF2147 domain-containing protein [Falsirhodobacter deserti]|uniref:DUF2147 domain-containing protein n=1 Tax=Falsirhodobacter deserti TaxID=1365611 RepID=UPI000FE304B9|nr:DUF2147 domain-containing protein [Falsirhodobacter deserti]
MRLLALILMTGPAFAADPIEGVWRTQANDAGGAALVEMAPCRAGFCGTVIGDVDAAGQRVPSGMQGSTIIREVTGRDGLYTGGRVLNPETGRSYAARLVLDGDTLDVGGCLVGICRSGGIWRRVD